MTGHAWWRPSPPRPFGQHTVPYRRNRPRPRNRSQSMHESANSDSKSMDTRIMTFDQSELPVATVYRVSEDRIGMIAGQARRWLTMRWRWFQPRTVPIFVAVLGMVGMLLAEHFPPGRGTRNELPDAPVVI